MGWFGEVILLLLTIRYALSGTEVQTINLPQNFMDEEILENLDNTGKIQNLLLFY